MPVAMGRELYRLANEPKRIVTFPRGGHSDLYLDGNNALDAVRRWIADLKRYPEWAGWRRWPAISACDRFPAHQRSRGKRG